MRGAIGGFYDSCQGVYDPVKLCSSLACNEKRKCGLGRLKSLNGLVRLQGLA